MREDRLLSTDHPSVEIRVPFDGGTHRLAVPPETTRFYWGAVGVGTANDPPAAVASKRGISPSTLLDETRDRVDCSLAVDGDAEPLLTESRRADGRRERAFRTATDPDTSPLTATVTLSTLGAVPTVGDEEGALRTADGAVIQRDESITTGLRLVPASTSCSLRTDGLWGRHDVYVPRSGSV